MICDDFACVEEYPLLRFLIDWARENDMTKNELARVIEHVRFTRMSMENYFEAVTLPELKLTNTPLSMKRGKKFHDTPITTRRTAINRPPCVMEDSRVPREVVLTIGGCSLSRPCNVIESFNNSSKQWKIVAEMPFTRNLLTL